MGNFRNSKSGQLYLDGVTSEHILGRTYPVRAQTGLDYYLPPYPAEVEGAAIVLTEVVPWPWSADDEGVAFDQANLYGVRTRCWRLPLADGVGDKDDWVAVPKSLQVGYTAVGRCGILVPGLYAGYLDGITPETSATWNHRTHTGLLWDLTDPAQAARASWSPMNRNQTVSSGSVSFAGAGAVPEVYDPVNDGYDSYPYAYMANSHVGFRGGRLELTYINAGPSWPVTVRREFTIQAWPITDPAWTIIEQPPANKVTLSSISASHTFAAPGADYTETFTLPALVLPANGIPCNIVLVGRSYIQEGFGPGSAPAGQDAFLGHFVFNQWLSPRTNVPLWYFASMGNRCAPGGVITP